jgi:hypothetical protein
MTGRLLERDCGMIANATRAELVPRLALLLEGLGGWPVTSAGMTRAFGDDKRERQFRLAWAEGRARQARRVNRPATCERVADAVGIRDMLCHRQRTPGKPTRVSSTAAWPRADGPVTEKASMTAVGAESLRGVPGPVTVTEQSRLESRAPRHPQERVEA